MNFKGVSILFFLFGISAKIKPAGIARRGFCPACRQEAPLHLTHKYITPHIFFIPTIRFNSSYVATCPYCASVMGLEPEKMRQIRQNPDTPVYEKDLNIIKDNSRFGGKV